MVMRHAQAESFAETDRERRLTDRGHRDAAEAGAWLAAQDLAPSHALVSGAVRTRETWAAVAGQLPGSGSVDVSIDESLYTAGPDAAIEVLRLLPDQASRVVLVGHNPTMAHLVTLLDGGDADPDAFAGLSRGYPPAALTVLEYDGPWRDLGPGECRIAAFHVGQG